MAAMTWAIAIPLMARRECRPAGDDSRRAHRPRHEHAPGGITHAYLIGAMAPAALGSWSATSAAQLLARIAGRPAAIAIA